MPQDMKAGTAEDVAELVAYLAKPEAWYVTGVSGGDMPPSGHVDTFSPGQCININGGIAMD